MCRDSDMFVRDRVESSRVLSWIVQVAGRKKYDGLGEDTDVMVRDKVKVQVCKFSKVR